MSIGAAGVAYAWPRADNGGLFIEAVPLCASTTHGRRSDEGGLFVAGRAAVCIDRNDHPAPAAKRASA